MNRSYEANKRYLRFGCIILILILTLSALVSCAYEIEPIDEELRKRVEADYTSYLCEKNNWDKDKTSAYIRNYYGIHNGCVVAVFDGNYMTPYPMISEEVAGFTFTYGSTRMIEVWKDGEICTLKEAYTNGLLKKNDIKRIAEIHENREYSVFSYN